MKPAERERIVSYATRRQLQGDVLGYSIDESTNQIELFVPLDAEARSFPKQIGSTRVLLVWLPRPQEQEALAWPSEQMT